MRFKAIAFLVGISSLAIGLAPFVGGCMVGFDREFDFDGDGVAGAADCDDTAENIYPGAEEVCGDGVDQDCDSADVACPAVDDGSRSEPTPTASPSPTPTSDSSESGDKGGDESGNSANSGAGNNGNGNGKGGLGNHGG